MEHTLYIMIQDLHRKLDSINERMRTIEEIMSGAIGDVEQEEETIKEKRFKKRTSEE